MSIASITGALVVSADDNSDEFLPTIALDERHGLARHAVIPVDLASDAPVAVQMNGVSAHVLWARSATGKVSMTVSSADGASQTVPVDRTAILISRSVPFTSISFTRVAGEANSVKLFIGQLA